MRQSAAPSVHRADIQGLRALAIGLVVISHTSLPVLRGGFIGVDVFFVISGFLITSHLASSLRRTGRIDLAAFYARRARRILPAALLVAAATLVAGTLVLPPLALHDLAFAARSVVFFVPNMYLAFQHVDYSNPQDPSPFQQYWSLGVEEQFYLVFPLVLALLFAAGRAKTGVIVGGLTVVTGLSFAIAVILVDVSPTWAFFSLPSRAWEFGFGALASFAVAGRLGEVLARAPRLIGHSFATVGLGLIVAAAVLFDETTRFPGAAALWPVVGTMLIILAGSTSVSRSPTQRLLATRPFQYLGDVSYSLYLWHWPLLILPAWALVGTTVPVWGQLLAVLVAVSLAHLTRKYVERPFIGLKAGGPLKSVGLAGVAATVVAALLAGSAVAKAAQDHAVLAGGGAVASVGATTAPQFSPFVPSNLEPSLDQARDSTTRATTEGCHVLSSRQASVNDCVFGDPAGSRTVVLFGDSHAEHWLTGLDAWAVENDVRVRSWTKAGCPSTDLPLTSDGRPFVECHDWREGVFRALEHEKPDLVVLSNANYVRFETGGLSVSAARAIGIERTLDRLPNASAVVSLADTPELGADAPMCLSAHLDRAELCASSRAASVDQDELDAQRKTFESRGASFVDLNDYLCSAETCGPIIGNTLVYRDNSHLTPAWSLALAAPLGAALAKAIR